MDRNEMWQVIDSERASMADFLDDLSDAEWTYPSLCDGWRVRDVAAHLTLAPYSRVRDMVVAAVKARGNFNRLIHDTAVEQAKLPTTELVSLLRGAAGIRKTAPGQKVKDAMMDVIVHGQDIALPLGRPRPVPMGAAIASANHLWRIGFPFHARKRLRGRRLVATDADWSVGEGDELRAPVATLLMVLAGREVALAR